MLAWYAVRRLTLLGASCPASCFTLRLQPMDLGTVQCVVQLMQQLMEQPLWDVRCGGYLGLKYTLAGRLDLGKQLLQVLFGLE